MTDITYLDNLRNQLIDKELGEMSEKEIHEVQIRTMRMFNFWNNEIKDQDKLIKHHKKVQNEGLEGYERFKSWLILSFFSKSNSEQGFFTDSIKHNSKIIVHGIQKDNISLEEAARLHSHTSELGMMDRFLNNEDGGKIFKINNEIIKFIDKTYIKEKYIEVPFNNIFISLNEYFIKDVELIGVLIRKREIVQNLGDSKVLGNEIEILTICLDHKDGNIAWVYGYIFDDKLPKKSNIDDHNKINQWCSEELKKEIIFKSKSLILNILNLINSPDVEMINNSRKYLRESKRKKGLLGTPDEIEINLTGKLKKYIYETNQENASRSKLRYKFWVRGHWVSFKNSRYINMIGKKKWILPFIKGKGELIKKEYYVGKKEQQWRNEKRMVKIIQDIYSGDNLERNNRTVLNGLEIDCYIPSLKLGFEYNGEQHYNHVKVFHKTKEDFESQKQRDIEKNKRAKEQGINLITIRYDEILSEELILSKIKEVTGDGGQNK